MRVANQTGCAVGALITNGGTLYTSAPAVAASAGASVWLALRGMDVVGEAGGTYAVHIETYASESGNTCEVDGKNATAVPGIHAGPGRGPGDRPRDDRRRSANNPTG
jgi:hypothetical protein